MPPIRRLFSSVVPTLAKSAKWSGFPRIAHRASSSEAKIPVGEEITQKDLFTWFLTRDGQFRTEIKTDINNLRTELKADINTLRTEVKTDIASLKADINKVEAKIDQGFQKAIAFSGLMLVVYPIYLQWIQQFPHFLMVEKKSVTTSTAEVSSSATVPDNVLAPPIMR